MIAYHGTPLTPASAAARILAGRHAMVSFAYPEQTALVAAVVSSFVLDNGAFTAWKAGKAVDWGAYYDWAGEWTLHPACDWALIPDVIDGTEAENDSLLARWPLVRPYGVPVWHLHESLERLAALAGEWHRVALGSSGQYAAIGTPAWWSRMGAAMAVVCGEDGRPLCKLHGLRMLHKGIRRRIPLASADSTNVARNVNLDVNWPAGPADATSRGYLLADRVEIGESTDRWRLGQMDFLGGAAIE